MDVSLLLEPVSPEQPAGSDVRYEPVFDNLQSEMDRLAVPSDGGIRWSVAVELACDILAHRSKDLVVAGYLAVALVHTHGSEGALWGLQLYAGLLERYWDDLHPPPSKARARILALEWWLEKFSRALDAGSFPLTEPQSLLAQELVEKIERVVGERLANGPPLTPLKAFFRGQLLGGVEGAVETNVSAGAGGAEGDPVRNAERPLSPASPVCDLSVPADAARAIEAALEAVRQAAVRLRQDDPENPIGYRLLRLSLWSALASLPPALEGRTRIAAPEARVCGLLRELRRELRGEALLDAAESRLPHFIFWLDLNRLSFEALGLLGDSYRDAQLAVLEESTQLLKRLPGLLDLGFSDGTPFADGETRRWLAEHAAARISPDSTHSDSLPSDGPEERGGMVQALEEAQFLLREGKLLDALESLHRKLHQASGGRERIRWRLALVRFLFGARAYRLALPQLEEVLAEVDRHRIESYEPELALCALKLAYVGYRAQGEGTFQEKAVETLFRIGRLDPAEMMRVEKG